MKSSDLTTEQLHDLALLGIFEKAYVEKFASFVPLGLATHSKELDDDIYTITPFGSAVAAYLMGWSNVKPEGLED